MSIQLRPFKSTDLETLWQLGFSQVDPAWTKTNAPYFEEYQAYSDSKSFIESALADFFLSSNVQAVFYQGELVGMVSRYWESQKTRWMEVGIVIYADGLWSKGIGTQALTKWVGQTFEAFPSINHLGLTTWSGNPAMMALARKIGFQEEGRIRQVRYWQGYYYDSMKYGVLRSEWKF